MTESQALERDSILRTVSDLVALAPRATGTPGGEAAADYVAARFEAAGLDDVWFETDDSFAWSASRVGLRIGEIELPVSPILHSALREEESVGTFGTGEQGVTAPVVDVGRDRVDAHDVRGAIVLFDLRFEMSLWHLLPFVEYLHDPGRRVLRRSALSDRNPYVTSLTRVMNQAKHGGAVGVAGVLADYPESIGYRNEYYRRSVMGLPGVWTTRATGAAIRRQLREQPEATLTLCGERTRVPARSVVGVLHGRSPETIMVQSHHDSVGPGAVEDATGTAEVVALAEHEAARAAWQRRDKTLMFVTFDTHFTGYQAHQAFAQRYALDPASPFPLAVNLTIEHVGLRARIAPDRGFETLPETEPRAVFENVSLPMKRAIARAIRRHGLRSTVMLNASAFELGRGGIPTDASFIFASGVPTISLVSGPLYLYDDADTLEQVDVDQLEPVARAFADLVDESDRRPAGRLGLAPRRLRRLLPRGRW